MVARACNPSTLGSQGSKLLEIRSLNLISTKNIQVWWHVPVVLATRKAEVGGLSPGGRGCSELRLHYYTPARASE